MSHEREVGTRQDRAGTRAQAPSGCFDVDADPMPPHVDQNAIALRLAGEARAGGTERHALMFLPRVVEHFAHVVDSARDHHHLGEKSIRTGISRVADEIDGSREHAVGAKKSHEIVAQPRRRPRRDPVRRTVALRGARWRHDGPDIRGEQCEHVEAIQGIRGGVETCSIVVRNRHEVPVLRR